MRMGEVHSKIELLVADEAWIAAALLHREFPDQGDFSVREIIDRARKENITGLLRPGVEQHVRFHCVANKPPEPGRYCMLFATARGRRRLYRPGDTTDPGRTGKTLPEAHAIPERYRYLLDWYRNEYAPTQEREWLAGLTDMISSGREIFAGQDPDEYVSSLRESWK